MAKGWQSLDAGFPSFSREESVKQMVDKMHNYLFQVKQGLRITFQDLEADIAKLKRENKTLKKKIEQLETQISGNVAAEESNSSTAQS